MFANAWKLRRVVSLAEMRFSRVEDFAACVGGVFMLFAMVLVSTDAILRYFFSFPLLFVYQLTERYLLVGLATLPMAWGFRTGGYVRIVGFVSILKVRQQSVLLRCGLAVGAFYTFALAVLSFKNFLTILTRGDMYMGVYNWPVSWSWVWVPIGLGLLTIRLAFNTLGPYEALRPKISADHH